MTVSQRVARRALPLVALGALAVLPAAHAAPGDAVKKLKGALDKAAQVEGGVPADDARLVELGAALDEVGKQGDADAARALMGVLMQPFPSPTVEVFAAEHARDALEAIPAGPGRDEVRGALDKKKKDARVAVPLAQVVASWSEPASVTAVAELLTQKDATLIMAGARGLATLNRKECVRPLITAFGALREGGGEPLEAVGRALVAITGQSFRTPEDWLKWWEPVEGTWDPSQKQQAAGEGTRTRHFQPQEPPDLFESVTIRSKRVVIIIDTSGSMHIRNYIREKSEPLPPTPPRRAPSGDGTNTREPAPGSSTEGKPAGDAAGGGAAAGGGGGGQSLAGPPLPPGVNPDDPAYKKKPCTFAQCPGANGHGPPCPSDENLPDWFTRMERLKRQVEKAIRSFQPTVRFSLVAFSTDARPWQRALVPADERNKRAAIEWVKGLRADGATSALKAIDAAFAVPDADTFLFVTDGAPTNPAGRPYDEGRYRELLDEVKRQNKVRNVRIDVITIAEGHTSFARGLAAENGGQYTSVP